MTRARVHPVLVTGATGRVGRAVVTQLLDAGVPARAHAPTGDGGAAGDRRGRGGRPHRARVARRGAAGRRCGFSPLDRAADHRSCRRRASRVARAARRLSLLAAPDAAPVLPAAEPHGSPPRRRRAPDRGCRTRVDDHPAGDVRVEHAAMVGVHDPGRRRRPVALRRGRDGTYRRARHRGRGGARPV